MMHMTDVRDNVAEFLGLKPQGPIDRLRSIDWSDLNTRSLRSNLPNMRGMSRRNMDFNWDATTGLIVGIVAGIGLGIGLGYALKGNVKPAVQRARQTAKDTTNRMRSRLNITRMEEQPAQR